MSRRSCAKRAVHPRLGGEHRPRPIIWISVLGSSPRGRGTLTAVAIKVLACRFISAWAGNTTCRWPASTRRTVHPRVGGEHQINANLINAARGSSPRGRGTPLIDQQPYATLRFIPAWAGNTAPRPARGCPSAVHPRVGGEHRARRGGIMPACGSSPRGRGTHSPTPWWPPLYRFIPAWAGNTARIVSLAADIAVHPRVGGEHPRTTPRASISPGSSPRGRGTQRLRVGGGVPARFIPAWAGNTNIAICNTRHRAVHPRVGGEHLTPTHLTSAASGSSPRGRGTRVDALLFEDCARFIPAWAGNTRGRFGLGRARSVHPRVGGEHRDARANRSAGSGSSPRGRGTRAGRHGLDWVERFIPAWAGNTSGGAGEDDVAPVHPRVGGEHSFPSKKV